jgi:hypothetical protein
MRPDRVIVFDIFFDQVSEMPLPKDKEIIQTFSFNCPYPAFRIRVKVR